MINNIHSWDRFLQKRNFLFVGLILDCFTTFYWAFKMLLNSHILDSMHSIKFVKSIIL